MLDCKTRYQVFLFLSFGKQHVKNKDGPHFHTHFSYAASHNTHISRLPERNHTARLATPDRGLLPLHDRTEKVNSQGLRLFC